MDTTGQDLVEFWTTAGKRGLLNLNTASSYAGAVRKVLNVEDDWKTRDVTQLNVDDLITRFQNRNARDLTPKSLGTYERRFRAALQSFLEYAQDPKKWKFEGQAQPSRKDQGRLPGRPKAKPRARVADDGQGAADAGGSSVLLLEYPFRLRENCIVRLRLPVDLRVAEVERLATMMRTLTVDSVPPQP